MYVKTSAENCNINEIFLNLHSCFQVQNICIYLLRKEKCKNERTLIKKMMYKTKNFVARLKGRKILLSIYFRFSSF